MRFIQGLGRITQQVPDPVAAAEMLQTLVGMTATEVADGEVLVQAGDASHWFRFVPGDEPATLRSGYALVPDVSLEQVTAHLDSHGVAWTASDDATATDHVREWIRVAGPDGIEIELYNGMVELPTPPPSRAHLATLLHSVYSVSSLAPATDFFVDVMGFRVSDWLGDAMSFMRAENHFHHSLGVQTSRGEPGDLVHCCILCESFDDLMILRRQFLNAGRQLSPDLVHHRASGSMGFYTRDEASGLTYEFCTGHAVVDEADHVATVLEPGPSTADMWNVALR